MKLNKLMIFLLLSTLPLIIVPRAQACLSRFNAYPTLADDPLDITVSTNKDSYYRREVINVEGIVKQDGTLVSDALVAIEVRDPSALPVTFRTAATGDVSSMSWPVQFTDMYSCADTNGVPKYSFVVGENLYIRCTMKNFDSLPHNVLVGVSLYDGKAIPHGVWYPSSTEISPGGTKGVLFFATRIPGWAYPGNATLFGNLFSALPKDGGIPYCPEKAVSFEIKRNPDLPYSSPPVSTIPGTGGKYVSAFMLSPESKSGTYTTYATTSKGLISTQNVTTFSVESFPTPPQASFFYLPIEPYVNMSVKFDASSSTAEGYNDNITKYEWNFGNGTIFSATIPTINNTFTTVGTYVVTLNVTDTEGLWSTTSKPIMILPPVGPTADFITYPSNPLVNQAVNFSAASSKPGWNGTAFSPIVNYTWSFGDTNTTSGNYQTIIHTYSVTGTYNVTLTVTDANGRTGNVTKTVIVSFTALIGDINGDRQVNILDAILLGNAFGSVKDGLGWDPRADLNNDNEVNILDAIIFGNHFGESAP
jgi:PKD repeat protein